MLKGIDHVAMSVKSLSESVDWYSRIFDFEVVEAGKNSSGQDFKILRKEDTMMCLYEVGEKAESKDSKHHRLYHFGFRISDPQAWQKKILEESLRVELEQDYPHSKSWYIADPTGHENEVSYWHNDSIKFG